MRRLIGIGVLAAVLAGGVALVGARPDLLPFGVLSPEPEVVYAHPSFEFDPTDDRNLAAYATDIFLGRVVAQTGSVGAPTSAPGQEVPQAQFAVEVLRTVKGNATGTVTVNQIGGFDRTIGKVFLFEGDELLKPGQTVLLVTGHVVDRGWYQIVAAGFGHHRAETATRRTALVQRFADAERHSRLPGFAAPPAPPTPSP